MTSAIAANHPKQKLLFFVAQGLDERTRADTRQLLLRLASLRPWLNGPPRFVNSYEEAQDSSKGDLRTETVGGFIELYSVLPPSVLPREADLQHLEEVTALVAALREFSRERGLSIELELDGESVGAIHAGEMDRSLAVGLLGEWRRHLGV